MRLPSILRVVLLFLSSYSLSKERYSSRSFSNRSFRYTSIIVGTTRTGTWAGSVI